MDRGTKMFSPKIWKLASPPLLAAAVALMCAVGLSAQSDQMPQPQEGKTAGEVYKNIQVLKDIPSTQLIPGMRYITTALGVECSFCHVQGNFASDDKQPKQTARQMMQMLFAINKNNFDGRPEISCFTCHQGNQEPTSVPKLPADVAETQFIRPTAGEPAQPIPNADAVLASYARALGGDEALGKIKSREIQVQESSGTRTFEADMFQEAPNKMYSLITLPQGTITSVYNGTEGWMTSPRGTEKMRDMNAITFGREAELNPVAALQAYSGRRVFGQAKIGDAMAYIMRAKAPDGEFEFLFFDEKTGLLIRRSIRYQTVFGSLPLQADYSDYREVDGVQVPYKVTWSTAGRSTVFTVQSVKDNVPIDDSKFAAPAEKTP